MLDLLIGSRRPGRALFAVLCLAATSACHDDPKTPVPALADLAGGSAVVDYSTWPLGRLEVALAPPPCAAPVPAQEYFRNLSPDEAKTHGFGIVDGYLETARLGIDAPAPCPFTADEARLSAFSQAVTIFLNDSVAKEAYGRYGECMVREGIEGATNPMEAELLVIKRYSMMLDASATPVTGGASGATAATPAGEVLEHGDELRRYERRIATTTVRCQAITLAPSARQLIAAQRRVIDTAPAEQKALLER